MQPQQLTEDEPTSRVWWSDICHAPTGPPLLIPGGSGPVSAHRPPPQPTLARVLETPPWENKNTSSIRHNKYSLQSIYKRVFVSGHLHVLLVCWSVSWCWRWSGQVAHHISDKGASWRRDWGYARPQAEEQQTDRQTTAGWCLLLSFWWYFTKGADLQK